MIEYLKSLEVKKPHNIKCDVHAERIQMLVHYINALPGTLPIIDGQTEKMIVFQSFPTQWLLEFAKVDRYPETETLDHII